MTETDWLEFISYAAGAKHLAADYAAVTKETPPTTFDALGADVLKDSDPDLRSYLQWATVSHWSSAGVPVKFWEEARARWPNIRLPKFQMD
ncbi:MAG: hypothetical protein M9924_07790 [Rhizobiaceae bacterium]|nr:hypothetical protein [Rhizobiaceae bacterium]